MQSILRFLLGVAFVMGLLPTARALDSWSVPPLPSGLPVLETVAFGSGLFVAAGAGDTYATSTDGMEWSARALPAPASGGLNRIAYADGMFVGVGNGGQIITSTDGLTWSVHSSGTTVDLISLASAGGGRWAALGRSGDQAVVLESIDHGQTWSAHPEAAFTPHGLTFGSGSFLAAASAGLGTDLRRSQDLQTWTSTLGYDMGAGLVTVAHGADPARFVAAGESGRLMFSADGAAWTGTSSGVSQKLFMVRFLNGQFVATGDAERIVSSANGETWQVRRAPAESGTSLRDIAFGNQAWVTVGVQQGASWWDPATPAILVSDAASAGRISFAAADRSVDEASGTVTLQVNRLGATTGSITVDYFTSDGTATGRREGVRVTYFRHGRKAVGHMGSFSAVPLDRP